MGPLSAIPIIGWLLAPIIAACVAIPFYFLWHACNVKKFFMFLPDVYINIGFFEAIGLFIVLSIIKSVALPSMSSTVNNNK